MADKTYSELLRDPRWQRKRLEIMQRDGFACTECYSTTTTLNVHHRYYERNRSPWEYPDEALQTLCEGCHDKVTDIDRRIKRQLAKSGHREKFMILGFAAGLETASELFSNMQLTPPECISDIPFITCAAVTSGFLAALGAPDNLKIPHEGPQSTMLFEDICVAVRAYLNAEWEKQEAEFKAWSAAKAEEAKSS